MTNQAIPVTSLSGPPVSRWLGFFPEFRDDSLGFLLRCHAYGDVVKLPMGQMAELLFRRSDLAIYFLNHPDDVKHVLVTNQHNYAKTRVPPGESRVFGKGVIHTEGETHHHQRRLFLPFFHGDHVASYTGLVTERAAALALNRSVAQNAIHQRPEVRRRRTQLEQAACCIYALHGSCRPGLISPFQALADPEPQRSNIRFMPPADAEAGSLIFAVVT